MWQKQDSCLRFLEDKDADEESFKIGAILGEGTPCLPQIGQTVAFLARILLIDKLQCTD